MIVFQPMAKRAGRYANGSFVHFRTDTELVDDLDRIVEGIRSDGAKATRSSVARTLLRKALDHDPTRAEVKEVLVNVHRVTQMAMNRITNEVVDKIPGYLDDAAAELDGAPQ